MKLSQQKENKRSHFPVHNGRDVQQPNQSLERALIDVEMATEGWLLTIQQPPKTPISSPEHREARI